MGCSTSKLDDEEAVQVCRDRRKFIKQAVEQRHIYALGLVNYIQSLRKVSIALFNFVQGNEQHQFLQSHYTTTPFTPVKINGIPETHYVINYLRSNGNVSVPVVEEWPVSPEVARVESYYHPSHYGIDEFFPFEASQMNQPSSSSPYNTPSYAPVSPQNSQWDFLWNPFSSLLDQYRYQLGSNVDDESVRLSKVREEEGIPALEEYEIKEDDDDDDDDDVDDKTKEDEIHNKIGDEKTKTVSESKTPLVSPEKCCVENEKEREKVNGLKECQSQGVDSIEVAESQDAVEVEASVRNSGEEGTPGFTVYVNRRPTSMAEVMKDIDSQFASIFDAVQEVSVMLETSRAQYSVSKQLTGVRMLHLFALFSSPSSLSSSSRFFQTSTSSRDEGDETSSNYLEEHFPSTSGSHQSTLDRLYAWEKKLYEEVKCGEGIRIAYEKKCMQLRKHDVNGEEPSVVDKTRAAIRDLHTQFKVSLHSVESVSRRIETLRDEELYPQLMVLIQGLSRMWRRMGECHRIQKRTIDEAKLLLFSCSSSTLNKILCTKVSQTSTHNAPMNQYTAANNILMLELRYWRCSFAAWINAERAYARALSGWTSRCSAASASASASSNSTNTEASSSSTGPLPAVCRLCVGWSRLLDSVSVNEGRHVIEGMDFFAAGIESVTKGINGSSAVRERGEGERDGVMDLIVSAEGEEGMKEVGERVVCAGMAAVVGSLTEYADTLAQGYEALLNN